MPLRYRKNKKAFRYNVAELRRSGKSRGQALRIAYNIRRGYKPKRLKRRRKSSR